MVVRAIALSMALLIGIAGLVSFSTNSVEAGQQKSRKYGKKKYKKYSKAWWRQYRARMNHRRMMAAKRRALRLRQLRLAKRAEQDRAESTAGTDAARGAKVQKASVEMLPSGEPAPLGWKRNSAAPAGELQFTVDDGRGGQLGSASIAVVGPAMGESSDTFRNRSIGGVPTTSLRREVINRMINENGWVVNDFQKEIGGKKVYVVVAQSQNGSRISSRTFYFTEVDGRIFSVSTNSSADSAERLAEESEKVINSLQSRTRGVQRAAVKEE
ncbi:MAG: hypothetical protein ACK4S4_12730 [Pyrinomonadaceae bacterium]